MTRQSRRNSAFLSSLNTILQWINLNIVLDFSARMVKRKYLSPPSLESMITPRLVEKARKSAVMHNADYGIQFCSVHSNKHVEEVLPDVKIKFYGQTYKFLHSGCRTEGCYSKISFDERLIEEIKDMENLKEVGISEDLGCVSCASRKGRIYDTGLYIANFTPENLNFRDITTATRPQQLGKYTTQTTYKNRDKLYLFDWSCHPYLAVVRSLKLPDLQAQD
jgi:hypothetical protein